MRTLGYPQRPFFEIVGSRSPETKVTRRDVVNAICDVLGHEVSSLPTFKEVLANDVNIALRRREGNLTAELQSFLDEYLKTFLTEHVQNSVEEALLWDHDFFL